MSTLSTNRCGSIFPIPFCFLGRSSQTMTRRYTSTTPFSLHPVIPSWPGNWEQWLKNGMFLSLLGAGETPVMLGGVSTKAMLSNQNQFGHILILHQRNQRLVDKVRDLWKKIDDPQGWTDSLVQGIIFLKPGIANGIDQFLDIGPLGFLLKALELFVTATLCLCVSVFGGFTSWRHWHGIALGGGGESLFGGCVAVDALSGPRRMT